MSLFQIFCTIKPQNTLKIENFQNASYWCDVWHVFALILSAKPRTKKIACTEPVKVNLLYAIQLLTSAELNYVYYYIIKITNKL